MGRLTMVAGTYLSQMLQLSQRARAKMARARAKMAKAKTERARERARARKERHPLSLLPRALAPWSSLPAKRPPLQILMRNRSSERLMENLLLHDHTHSQSGSGL